MLLRFDLYHLYVLSFVQLVVATALVLSPAREIGIRFRWTGSRITEVLVGAAGGVAIAAVACVLTQVLWGLPISGLETAALPLVVVSVTVIALQPDRNLAGHIFYASYTAASFSFIVWSALITVSATHSIAETLTASLVLLLDMAALLVWISNINYQTDVLCRSRRGRPLPKADPAYRPMVSIHIPAYNEPPELLIQTIQAAEAIDYPDFEIVVMDNNTKDPAVWGPVEEYCRDRPRVRFVHVAPWPGYKAGACNLALRRYTDPRAEIIGLIDADDLVRAHYLAETVPYFCDPDVGFVQTFEGNREFEGSSYYTACVDSYQAFYLSNMSTRNERDTVPFVGTMGLFRRSALTAIGGWNEWCICEDTEASLRVLKDGWSGVYIPRCFGRGIVPPSFAGMLTQRHRWCYGAMQILRLHWRSLMPWDRSPDNHLTAAQRRDYLTASLSWFRDLVMLAFSLLLLVITGLLVADSGFAVAPMDGSRSLLPLSLIIIATITMMGTLRLWTTMSFRRAVLSLVISLSVTWVIALGCIEGVARRDGVFLRTSKAGGRRTILTALKLTRWETVLAATLYVSAGLLAGLRHRPWLLLFIVFVQATVYLCGPIAAVWNQRARTVPARERQPALAAARRRRPRALFPRPASAALTRAVRRRSDQRLRGPHGAAARDDHGADRRSPAVTAGRRSGHRGLPPAGLVRLGHVLSGHLGAPGRPDPQLRHVLGPAAGRDAAGGGRWRADLASQPGLPRTGPGRPGGHPAGGHVRHGHRHFPAGTPVRQPRRPRLAPAARGRPPDGHVRRAAAGRPVRRAPRCVGRHGERDPPRRDAVLCRDGGQPVPGGAGCPARPALHHVGAAPARPDLPGRRRRFRPADAHPCGR